MQRVVVKLTTGKKVQQIEVFTNLSNEQVAKYATDWLKEAVNLTARSLSKYIMINNGARCMNFRDYKRMSR